MNSLRKLIIAIAVIFGSMAFSGCASLDIDRSLINDPHMNTLQGLSSNTLSPLSNLKTRSKVNGGNSCSVCAH